MYAVDWTSHQDLIHLLALLAFHCQHKRLTHSLLSHLPFSVMGERQVSRSRMAASLADKAAAQDLWLCLCVHMCVCVAVCGRWGSGQWRHKDSKRDNQRRGHDLIAVTWGVNVQLSDNMTSIQSLYSTQAIWICSFVFTVCIYYC